MLNLGGHCATENAASLAEQWNYLDSPFSPGRRRRRRREGLPAAVAADRPAAAAVSAAVDRLTRRRRAGSFVGDGGGAPRPEYRPDDVESVRRRPVQQQTARIG